MIYEFNLEMSIDCVQDPFNMGMFYQLKVAFNMGTLLGS